MHTGRATRGSPQPGGALLVAASFVHLPRVWGLAPCVVLVGWAFGRLATDLPEVLEEVGRRRAALDREPPAPVPTVPPPAPARGRKTRPRRRVRQDKNLYLRPFNRGRWF